MNEIQAWQQALAAEHAAVFGYTALGGHLSGAALTLARNGDAEHRRRRDAVVARLLALKAQPMPAERSYTLPEPVTDSASALRVALGIEERLATVWRSTVSGLPKTVRQQAIDALSDAAVRAANWRRTREPAKPVTVPFPGQ